MKKIDSLRQPLLDAHEMAEPAGQADQSRTETEVAAQALTAEEPSRNADEAIQAQLASEYIRTQVQDGVLDYDSYQRFMRRRALSLRGAPLEALQERLASLPSPPPLSSNTLGIGVDEADMLDQLNEVFLPVEEKAPSPALIKYLQEISTPECQFTVEDLQQSGISISHFNTLLAIENHPLKKWFRWINMIYWIEQALHSPFLSRRSLQPSETFQPASRRPVYLTGRSLPLKEPLSIRLSYIVTALNQGTTNSFKYMLTLTAVGLALYKMIENILSLGSEYLPSLLSNLLDYKSNGLDIILHLLDDIQFRYTSFLFLLPPAIAVARAIFYAKQSRPLSLKHLDRWKVYFMHEDLPVYAEKNLLRRFLEAVLHKCRLPMPVSWSNKPEPARMSGCYLRLVDAAPTELHQKLVTQGHEVLLVRQSDHIKLGFKNTQGHYEERILDAQQFPELLRKLNQAIFDGRIHQEETLQALVNQAIQTFGGKTLLHTFSLRYDVLRWAIPFHPTGDRIEHMERRLRWDGRYLVEENICALMVSSTPPTMEIFEGKPFTAAYVRHDQALYYLDSTRHQFELLSSMTGEKLAQFDEKTSSSQLNAGEHRILSAEALEQIYSLTHHQHHKKREITNLPEWRIEILEFIADAAKHGHTLSKSKAIYSLAKIAHGLAFSQVPLLVQAGFTKLEVLAFLYAKVEALKVMTEESHRLWNNLKDPTHPKHLKIAAFVHWIFTRFNLWGVGDFDNRALALFFTLLAGGLFVSAAMIFRTLGQAIAQYEECPYRPYSFYHGYQYQHLYPETCFNAFSHVFDQPAAGEPFNRYLDSLPFFNMVNTTSIEWDSNKNWNGTILASVINTLENNGAPLTDIYIVGQDLSTPESVNALMSSVPRNAQLLYIGNSRLENINSQPTVALIPQVMQLTSLRAVYLVRNNLGFYNSNGTASTAQLLFLPNLEILSYEDNGNLGGNSDVGFLAIAINLKYAKKLKSITFNGCSIGYTSDAASVLFVQNLIYIKNTLEELNFKNNFFGLQGITSLEQLVQILPTLTQLKKLDLSGNNIPINETVFLQLIQAAAQLPNLQEFYFQQTIPLTVELVQQIRVILSGSNLITDLPVAVTPEEAVAYIQQLPRGTTVLDLRRKLSNPTPEVVTALFGAVHQYLPNVIEINVSDNQLGITLTGPSAGNVHALMTALQPIASKIRVFKINGNFLDYQTSNDTIAFSEVLPYFTALTRLEVDNNLLENVDGLGVRAFFSAFRYLSHLTHFSAKGNLLGSKNTLGGQALGSSIVQAKPPLVYLDLSFNFLGKNGWQNVAALFNSFPSIASTLQILNMAFNNIGSTGTEATQAILAAFRQLPNLAQVYLQGALNIDWAQTNDALQNTLVPTINEAVMFQACDQIVCFRVNIPALNQLLGPVPASPLLPQAPLNSLFALPPAPGNHTQPVTSAASHLTLPFYLRLPLQLFSQIERLLLGDPMASRKAWGQHQAHSSGFEGSNNVTLQKAQANHSSALVMLDAPLPATRDFESRSETMSCVFDASHQQLVCVDESTHIARIVTSRTDQPVQEIIGDNYTEPVCFSTEYQGMEARKCVGETTEFVEFHAPETPEAPSVLETASMAAVKSAACVLLPEAADIALQAVGCSEDTGRIAKEQMQQAISLMAANSLLSASADLAGFAAGYLCRWWGAGAQTAITVASAVKATTVVVGQALQNPTETLTIAGTTVVSFGAAYAASRFTFWVKNKMQRNLEIHTHQAEITQKI